MGMTIEEFLSFILSTQKFTGHVEVKDISFCNLLLYSGIFSEMPEYLTSRKCSVICRRIRQNPNVYDLVFYV